MFKKAIITIITLLIGLTFIVSGITKYQSLDIYEIMLVKQGLSSWQIVRFVSRIIIAFEIALGLLIVFHYKIKFMMKATIVLLSTLTLFLGLQILLGVEPENCFCFGEHIQLNNLESIFKNSMLILMSVISLKNNKLIPFDRWKKGVVISSTFLIILTSVIILYPPINIYEEFSIDDFKSGDTFPQIEEFPGEIYKDKVILAFMSPKCRHCELVAMKLGIINNNVPYKIYSVFGFAEDKIPSFVEKTGLNTSTLVINKKDFLKFTKGVFPQVYILEDGKVKSIENKRLFMEKKL